MLNLSVIADDMQEYDELNEINNQLTLIYKNLLLVNAPINSQVITIATGNLYQVAEQYYGDATLWNVIANANNLVDPQINELINLVIPPIINSDNTGGILSA